ncbi:MAG: N-acetyltransferase family protein [Candidatus Thorarchaeota archaeon]|jgi:ribosomal protein S18 acetylase RimI-like enzyme
MTKDKLILRAATLDDMDSLVELWWESAHYHEELEPRFQYTSDAEKATREFMSKQTESEDACFWVAQIEDDIVGYIEAMVTEKPPIFVHRTIGHVGSIYVKPEARRKGIGSSLWNLARDWLVEKGVPTINLWVASQNPKALEFWKKFKFSEIEIRLEVETR